MKDGKAVKEFNRVYGILVDTLAPKKFVVETGSGVSGNEKRYIGNFENTRGHDIMHIYIYILVLIIMTKMIIVMWVN